MEHMRIWMSSRPPGLGLLNDGQRETLFPPFKKSSEDTALAGRTQSSIPRRGRRGTAELTGITDNTATIVTFDVQPKGVVGFADMLQGLISQLRKTLQQDLVVKM
jgi:hypothetical protein